MRSCHWLVVSQRLQSLSAVVQSHQLGLSRLAEHPKARQENAKALVPDVVLRNGIT